MTMDKNHKDALELCIRCIENGHNLAIWCAFGIPDEDRPKIIAMANERLSQREPSLFNETQFCTNEK